jgi:type III restriction enzyme
MEVRGHYDRAEVKAQAAQKWVEAVNADRTYGRWAYALARRPADVKPLMADAVTR